MNWHWYELAITEEQYEAWKGLGWAQLNHEVREALWNPWLSSYGARVHSVTRNSKTNSPAVLLQMYDSCD